jgi:hypothetical protein
MCLMYIHVYVFYVHITPGLVGEGKVEYKTEEERF